MRVSLACGINENIYIFSMCLLLMQCSCFEYIYAKVIDKGLYFCNATL